MNKTQIMQLRPEKAAIHSLDWPRLFDLFGKKYGLTAAMKNKATMLTK
jgi:hypothetical protein